MREPFSAISHYAGAVIFAVGFVVLLVLGAHEPVKFWSFLVYGVCAILLYLASGIYHSVHRHALWLRRFDHAAIYSMIAGSYTPVCMIGLPKPLGYQILAIEWGLALVGIASSLSMELVPHWLRIVLYIGMGWLAVVILKPLNGNLPYHGLAWLVAGGLIYTVGVIFYATERPRLWPGRFDAHDLWHLFVLTASACHFMVMLGLALS